MAVKTPETHTALVRRARKINRVLAETYPDVHTELDFANPFQLLVATVLSANWSIPPMGASPLSRRSVIASRSAAANRPAPMTW